VDPRSPARRPGTRRLAASFSRLSSLRSCLRAALRAALLASLLGGAFAAAGAEELVPLPVHPADLPWPTVAWPRAELPPGLDRGPFEASVERLFASRGRAGYADTRALLVVHRGRLVFERYAEGFDVGSRFQSWSMAKSVTNAFVGLLIREGRLELDAPAPVPEWSDEGDPRRAVTLRHLLQMRSGLANDDGFGEEDLTRSFVARSLFGDGATEPGAFAARVELVHPVGRHWAYSTGTSNLLARLGGLALGGGAERTRDFLRRELFAPLGMTSAQPEFALSGSFVGGAFVHATARDWARFGYLYLRDGVWDGRRILPEGWVDFSRTASPADDNAVYGAHFWLNREPPPEGQWKVLPGGPPDVFMAEGAYFQMVAVSPTRDLVAVRLGIAQGTPFPEIKEPFGPLIAAFPARARRPAAGGREGE